MVSVDVGPDDVSAGRVVDAAPSVKVSEEPGVVLIDSGINVVHGVVLADEVPVICVGGRVWYAKKAPDQWKVTAVTGRL